MEQGTKGGGGCAGNKGRGEVEWSREQRGDGVDVVNLEDCHSALGVRG